MILYPSLVGNIDQNASGGEDVSLAIPQGEPSDQNRMRGIVYGNCHLILDKMTCVQHRRVMLFPEFHFIRFQHLVDSVACIILNRVMYRRSAVPRIDREVLPIQRGDNHTRWQIRKNTG